MIIIVAVKMSIVLYQLELPWILIPRKLKYKEGKKGRLLFLCAPEHPFSKSRWKEWGASCDVTGK